MQLAYWCILIAGVMPVCTVAFSKAGVRDYDNAEPRAWLERQQGARRRADYAHRNHFEVGAIQCTPAKPDCLFCPLQQQCWAFQHGQVALLPVKSKAKAARTRYFHYFVLRYEGPKAASISSASFAFIA